MSNWYESFAWSRDPSTELCFKCNQSIFGFENSTGVQFACNVSPVARGCKLHTVSIFYFCALSSKLLFDCGIIKSNKDEPILANTHAMENFVVHHNAPLHSLYKYSLPWVRTSTTGEATYKRFIHSLAKWDPFKHLKHFGDSRIFAKRSFNVNLHAFEHHWVKWVHNSISTIDVTKLMQESINNFVKWCSDNDFELNTPNVK